MDNTGATNNVDSGADSTPESPADAGVATEPDPTTQAPQVDDINLLLSDISILLPDALLQSNARNDGSSATVPFTTQLLTLTQEANEAINAISTDQAMQSPEVSAQFNDSRFNNVAGFTLDNTDTIVASADAGDLRFFFSQATIVSLAESSIIAADLNENGIQTYLQSYSTMQFTAAFTQHPTDPTVPRQRELIDQTGTVTVLQNCTGAITDCISDSDFSNTDTDIGMQFSNATQAIATALSVPENAPSNALPDGVNEAVLTTSAATQPTEDQILCGLQTVDGSIQFFCLRPLPLESDASVFSETVSGGEIFYQLLQ